MSSLAIDLTYFQAAKVHFFSPGRWNCVLLAASAREDFKKTVGRNCLTFFVCLFVVKEVCWGLLTKGSTDYISFGKWICNSIMIHIFLSPLPLACVFSFHVCRPLWVSTAWLHIDPWKFPVVWVKHHTLRPWALWYYQCCHLKSQKQKAFPQTDKCYKWFDHSQEPGYYRGEKGCVGERNGVDRRCHCEPSKLMLNDQS